MAENVCDILNEVFFFIPGSPYKSDLFIWSSAVCNDFIFPQLDFETCYILLEEGTHSSHSHGHNAKHRQSFQRIALAGFVSDANSKSME